MHNREFKKSDLWKNYFFSKTTFMKILHTITFLTGGAGRVLVDLAKFQKESGQDVSVIANKTEFEGYCHYGEYLNILNECNIEIILVDSVFKRDERLNSLAVKSLELLFVSREQPDVIHAHSAIPAMVVMNSFSGHEKGLSNPSCIMTMHGWGLAKTKDMERQDVSIMNRSDKVVTLNRSGRDSLISKGVENQLLQIIPNGIARNPPSVVPSKRKKTDVLRLLCIGDLGERKNQQLLAKAVEQLNQRGLRCLATFVGKEGDNGYFRNKILAHASSDSVEWLGYHEDAQVLIPDYDAVVLPSRSEGLPIVILESFRAGVPFVGSNIPEISDVIEHGVNGYLFDNQNVESMIATLKELISHDTEPVVACAREDFESRFTLEKMNESYFQLYQELKS